MTVPQCCGKWKANAVPAAETEGLANIGFDARLTRKISINRCTRIGEGAGMGSTMYAFRTLLWSEKKKKVKINYFAVDARSERGIGCPLDRIKSRTSRLLFFPAFLFTRVAGWYRRIALVFHFRPLRRNKDDYDLFLVPEQSREEIPVPWTTFFIGLYRWKRDLSRCSSDTRVSKALLRNWT